MGTLDDVVGPTNALILAPHPDDESLGCGGLIAACCAASRPPVVAILTDGSLSHPNSRRYPPARLATLREQEATEAVGILGLPPDRLIFLRVPDTRAPDCGPLFESIVCRLGQVVQTFGCSSILAPWRFDPHGDHEAAAGVAAELARSSGIRLRSYPVWGWTLADDAEVAEDDVKGWRLPIATQAGAKRRAIAAHASQYGGLITDDPAGFRLPTELLRALEGEWETFLIA